MNDERYPIGTFTCPDNLSREVVAEWIENIRTFPDRLKKILFDLDESALASKHRDGGWTIRQLVHHIADSHMNYYIRIKLALTEENPTIKPFAEDRWAELSDSACSIESSVQLIALLQERLIYLLQTLSDEQLASGFVHPESGKGTVAECIGIYAWHGDHHLAHIQNAIKRYKSQIT